MRDVIRVLIVDDSATMRRLLRSVIDADPRFEVVGEAGDARQARAAVKDLDPDVMTLDVEMPGMSGLEFLERLMQARPMPVIMFSTLTAKGSDAALRALSLGAVDCIEKPRFGGAGATFAQLPERLLVAASAQVGNPRPRQKPSMPRRSPNWQWNDKWVLIGSSTGGVEALETILGSFPENCPPTLITQHMPAQFLESFARRLANTVQPVVRLATDGERVRPGHVYLAPGGETHLGIAPDGQTLRLLTTPKRSGHRPSVDTMFASAVPFADRMVAAILTGMGRDGAEQMRCLRDHGATCIGQDRDTSVVYGMPRIAQEFGALDEVLPLPEIAPALLRHTTRKTVQPEEGHGGNVSRPVTPNLHRPR